MNLSPDIEARSVNLAFQGTFEASGATVRFVGDSTGRPMHAVSVPDLVDAVADAQDVDVVDLACGDAAASSVSPFYPVKTFGDDEVEVRCGAPGSRGQLFAVDLVAGQVTAILD